MCSEEKYGIGEEPEVMRNYKEAKENRLPIMWKTLYQPI